MEEDRGGYFYSEYCITTLAWTSFLLVTTCDFARYYSVNASQSFYRRIEFTGNVAPGFGTDNLIYGAAGQGECRFTLDI